MNKIIISFSLFLIIFLFIPKGYANIITVAEDFDEYESKDGYALDYDMKNITDYDPNMDMTIPEKDNIKQLTDEVILKSLQNTSSIDSTMVSVLGVFILVFVIFDIFLIKFKRRRYICNNYFSCCIFDIWFKLSYSTD